MKLAILSLSLILASIGVASAHSPAYEGEKVILAEEHEEEHSILHQVREFFGLENDYMPKEKVGRYGLNYLRYQVEMTGVHSYNVSLVSIEDSEYDSLYRAEYNITTRSSEIATVYLTDDGEEMMRVPRKIRVPSDFELKNGETAEEYIHGDKISENQSEGSNHEH